MDTVVTVRAGDVRVGQRVALAVGGRLMQVVGVTRATARGVRVVVNGHNLPVPDFDNVTLTVDLPGDAPATGNFTFNAGDMVQVVIG